MKTTMLHMIQTKTKAPNECEYVYVYVKYLVLYVMMELEAV